MAAGEWLGSIKKGPAIRTYLYMQGCHFSCFFPDFRIFDKSSVNMKLIFLSSRKLFLYLRIFLYQFKAL